MRKLLGCTVFTFSLPRGLINAFFSKHITTQLVGLLHLPIEWTGSGEQGFNRLQRPVACLGVEEVYYGNPDQVQTGKEKVATTLDVVEHDGIDQRGHTNPNCPPSDPKPVTLGAQVRGENLRWQQKCYSAPCCGISVYSTT